MNKHATGISGKDIQHDSAHKHVTGEAEYIDDIVEPTGLLHAYLGLSDFAHGEITSIDFSDVLAIDGVVGVLTADDIPGPNDVSPTGKKDDPVFASNVEFFGQPIFAVIATTRAAARIASVLAKVVHDTKPHIVDVAEAHAENSPFVTEPLTLKRGEAEAQLGQSQNRIKGEMRIGGQDHFYLESHIALCLLYTSPSPRDLSTSRMPSSA